MTAPTAIVVAYGRVSTPGQSRGKNHDPRLERALASRFPHATLDSALEICAGSVPLEDRPVFLAQHLQAQRAGVPLWLDHSDRLLKSFDPAVIASAHEFLAAGGVVPLRFLHPNTWIHNSIRSLWASRSPRSVRVLAGVQQLQRYLSWRSGLLGSRASGESIPVPDPLAWDALRLDPYLPQFRACADLVLDLARFPDLGRLLFYLDAALGALFNQVVVHGRAVRARRRGFSPGQRSYGERPTDLRLFEAVSRLESVPTLTRSGRPKRVSDQSIATQLLALGFRNLHGRPFARKSVFDLRRSRAYQLWQSDSVVVPVLPTLVELRS